MPEPENLPFVVDLWAEDELSIVQMLAAAASLSIARAAFDTAAVAYPQRLVTLRGPGTIEIHHPAPLGRRTPANFPLPRVRRVIQ